MLRRSVWLAGVAAIAMAGASAEAQDKVVRIANVVELSGGGATVGTNWRDAIDMAAEEINAAGGIIGHKIELSVYDSQTNPAVSKAQVTKALDGDPFVVFGTVYSSSTKVNMVVTERAGVPQIVGSEAAELTRAGHPSLFRTSFSQTESMPKIAQYIKDAGYKTVAVIYVNNAFGKGGRDNIVPELEKRGVKIVADLSTEVQQVDYAAEVAKAKAANPDVIFAYLHEEESARLLIEIRKQDFKGEIIGETTITNAKVLSLAGPAGNGVKAHVGLSPDAPIPAIQEMAQKFEKKFGRKPDHNALKGYIGMYVVKEIVERIGSFDRAKFIKALHGATITTKDEPGVLMDVTYDDKGDISRASFLVEVVDGAEKITKVLPKL